jgi:CheY-like chemotaxis protein
MSRILLLDDEQAVVRAMALCVQTLGHEPVECFRPSEALSRLQAEHFDLLITDYRMPEMTGLDFVSLLRKEQCAIPVILVTASAIGVDRSLARQLGVSTILSKPFDFLDFKKAFQPHVEESVGQRQIAPASVQTSTNN